MQKFYLQFLIWGWQVKNSKWVNIIIAAFFLLGIPIIGVAFCQGMAVTDYELSYGYVIFIEKTILSVLGFIPLLLSLHGLYHFASGECMVLCSEWNESKQYLINYIVSALVILVMMTCMALTYHQGVKWEVFLRDLADSLVILWILYAISHLVVKISKSVYFALILTELYVILFEIMGMGRTMILNVYSIEDMDGMVWLIRMIMYVALGFVIEEIISLIHKVRYSF